MTGSNSEIPARVVLVQLHAITIGEYVLRRPPPASASPWKCPSEEALSPRSKILRTAASRQFERFRADVRFSMRCSLLCTPHTADQQPVFARSFSSPTTLRGRLCASRGKFMDLARWPRESRLRRLIAFLQSRQRIQTQKVVGHGIVEAIL